MKKRILSVILALCLTAIPLSGTAFAEGAAGERLTLGSCSGRKEAAPSQERAGSNLLSGEYGAEGDHVTWSFDPDTATLTLNGTGAMYRIPLCSLEGYF